MDQLALLYLLFIQLSSLTLVAICSWLMYRFMLVKYLFRSIAFAVNRRFFFGIWLQTYLFSWALSGEQPSPDDSLRKSEAPRSGSVLSLLFVVRTLDICDCLLFFKQQYQSKKKEEMRQLVFTKLTIIDPIFNSERAYWQ